MTTILDARRRTRWMLLELLVLFVVLNALGVTLRLIQSGLPLGLSEHIGYAIMTLHGLGMPSVFSMAVLVLAGWFLETKVDVRVPAWVWTWSFRIFRIGVALLIVATLVGGFAAGWYALYPIPFSEMTTWSRPVTGLGVFSVLVVGVALLVLIVALLTAMLRKFGWLDAMAWRNIGSVPPIVLISMASLINMSFSIVDGAWFLTLNLWQVVDPSVSFDPMMMKNIVFIFGHTLVNADMYMMAGPLYAVMPKYSGVPWKTDIWTAIAWNMSPLIVPGAFGHHTYMDFVNSHVIHYLGQAASFLSVVPLLLVTFYGAGKQFWGVHYGNWHFVPIAYGMAIMWWVIGGFAAVIDAMISMNFVFHNTLYVVAHFHTYGLMGLGFFLIGSAWDIFPGNEKWGKRAFLVMNMSGFMFVLAFYLAGLAGVPRQYAGYADIPMLDLAQYAQMLALIGGIGGAVFLAGLLALLGAFVHAHKR